MSCQTPGAYKRNEMDSEQKFSDAIIYYFLSHIQNHIILDRKAVEPDGIYRHSVMESNSLMEARQFGVTVVADALRLCLASSF